MLLRKAAVLGALIGGVFLVPGLAAESSRRALVPDASKAEIDGRVAVGAWPTVKGEIVGPEGFTVHLARDEKLEDERVYPAGWWFLPSPGRYRVWVEGREEGQGGTPWIMPTFTLLTYQGGPFRGRGFASRNEVVPAGSVVLGGRELSSDESLRLLHLDPVTPEGRVTHGFLRSVTADRQKEPVLMPAGRVVGLVWNRKANRYAAVSRPVEVRAGTTAGIHPTTEQGVSDVLAILGRHRPVEVAAEDDVELSLEDGAGQVRRPDLLMPASGWIYALWYDVEGKVAKVRAESGTEYLDPTEVVLEPGGVATLRGEMDPRPHLDVRLDLPPELKPEKATLIVGRRHDREKLVEQELSLDPNAVTRIEGLDPTELLVWLMLDAKALWKLEERVDLSDGVGRELTFRPRPILLSGTLYHGDEPTPGRIRLVVFDTRRSGGDKAELDVEVDQEGNYQAVLFDGGRFSMLVELPGVPGPPMPIYHVPYIEEDTEFDVRIPRSGVRVRVVDAVTGEPVEGAEVVARNKFDLEEGGEVSTRDAPSWTATDDEGWAMLPPQYPGEISVRASHGDYLRPEMVEGRILPDQLAELVVALEPPSGTQVLRLQLPDGRPAGGAELRAQPAAWDVPTLLWQGQADAAGEAQVPEVAEGHWLLVRHPQAGSWIQRWESLKDEAVTWTLPEAAGPLALRTVGLDGEPVGWMAFAVRFPTTWTAGNTLAWLTRSPVAASRGHGLWTARHLPAQPLEIHAGDAGTLTLAAQGFLSGTSVRVTPPWPEEAVDVPVTPR